jgi:hypothetical protein
MLNLKKKKKKIGSNKAHKTFGLHQSSTDIFNPRHRTSNVFHLQVH